MSKYATTDPKKAPANISQGFVPSRMSAYLPTSNNPTIGTNIRQVASAMSINNEFKLSLLESDCDTGSDFGFCLILE